MPTTVSTPSILQINLSDFKENMSTSSNKIITRKLTPSLSTKSIPKLPLQSARAVSPQSNYSELSISIYEDSDDSFEEEGVLDELVKSVMDLASEESSNKRRIKAQILAAHISQLTSKCSLKEVGIEDEKNQERIRKKCLRLAERIRQENNNLQHIISEIEKANPLLNSAPIKTLKNGQSKSLLKFIMQIKRPGKSNTSLTSY